MGLTKRPVAELRRCGVHVWGLPKSGKTRFALTAPAPCMVNFDRSEDWLLGELGLDILRDRIILPPGDITVLAARRALGQFEQDVEQAKAMNKGGGLVQTLVIDGGSLLLDVITLVKLDDSDNKHNTFRYAGRNAYIRNMANDLNESGLNVIWISRAKPVWVGENKVPDLWEPDVHPDIPYMMDVNLQMKAEPRPGAGLTYSGVIGMNAFNAAPVGVAIPNLTWDTMMALLFPTREQPSEETTDGTPAA